MGPSPRAFHVAVSIDCHIFIFGGRVGSKRFEHSSPIFTSFCIKICFDLRQINNLFRLGDFWMLDTGNICLLASVDDFEVIFFFFYLLHCICLYDHHCHSNHFPVMDMYWTKLYTDKAARKD